MRKKKVDRKIRQLKPLVANIISGVAFDEEQMGIVADLLQEFYQGKHQWIMLHGHPWGTTRLLLQASPKSQKRSRLARRKNQTV